MESPEAMTEDTVVTKFVRDVMSRSVLTCTLETPVREAARRMAQQSVSALVVVEESSGDLEGIISRTDLARAYEKDIDSLTVEMVMSHRVETIVPDIPVSAAVLIMLDHHVDRLVIMHAKPGPQRPVGVLSLSDIVRDMARQA
jgi:signal-transduction protein with cAMP-binding, CBS, and nucleotidyltransferase domain